MIGAPTNFQHTGHIGGGDLADMASAHLSAIQNQMQGKGGYEASFGVKVIFLYNFVTWWKKEKLLKFSYQDPLNGIRITKLTLREQVSMTIWNTFE